jgi:hypothetical protein
VFASKQILHSVPGHGKHEGRRAQQRAARKVAMADSTEHVEARRLAVDGLGDQLARESRRVDAVSRGALCEINGRRKATEVRRAPASTQRRGWDRAVPLR